MNTESIAEHDFSFGDIILVPFPFTNLSGGKQRPAVVISSESYNTERPDLIVMAITSQLKASSVFDEVAIKRWQLAGLLKPSVIKPVIATVEKTIVRRVLGRLHELDARSLRDTLGIMLGSNDGF